MGDPTKRDHDPMGQEYVAREEGWIYAYVSNENSTLVEVYFDDVTVTLTKSNLIQYNEYYPFGMQTANSWTRENTLGNNFLANGGTELNTTSNLYDLDYRNYDPVLGRMNGVDPLATSFASITPYNYSFNDPVTFTDPSGAKPEDFDKTDLDLYGGCLTCYYNNGGDFGSSNLLIMDPMGGGNYETWTPVTAGGYGVANAMLYSNEGLVNFSVFTNWINERINDRHRPARIANAINAAWNDKESDDILISNDGVEMRRIVPVIDFDFEIETVKTTAASNIINKYFVSRVVGFRTVQHSNQKGRERGINLQMPVSLIYRITSGYTEENRSIPELNQNRPHRAIDIGTPIGTPIRSPWSGTVVASERASYGLYVIVKHDRNFSYKGERVSTSYSHLSQVTVTKGTRVNKGDIIGYTGTFGTGPHLHFVVKIGGKKVNPKTLFPYE